MTNNQRISLQADWWPAACRAQGWKVSDRVMRIRVCAWCVSLQNPTALELLDAINSSREPTRVIQSTNDLDNKEDIDRVKACLGMLANNLARTTEVGRPEIGRARRLRDTIRDQLKCLALYPKEEPMGLNGARRYLAEIIKDKFRHGSRHEPLTIRDLTADEIRFTDRKTGKPSEIPSQLDQVIMTLGGLLNGSGKKKQRLGFRVAAGESLHQMKIQAGVYCDCSECSKRRAGTLYKQIEKPAEEDWSVFEPELEAASDQPF